MSQTLPYRPAVGLVVLNADNKLLAGYRADSGNPNGWQFPQGGRDGAAPEAAAWRELAEETGLTPDNTRLLGVLPEVTRYDYPPGATSMKYPEFRGQEHTWVVFRYLHSDLPDLARATDKEFAQLAWMGWTLFLGYCPGFKRNGYILVKDQVQAFLANINPR